MVHDDEPVGLDGVGVEFDDERAVCDAGIVVVATLASRLGIEALAGDLVRLRRDRPGAANAGRKVMALLYAMVLGAEQHRRHRRVALRSHGPAARRLDRGALDARDVPARVHVRACAPARRAAWPVAGAGLAGGRRPGRRRLVIDVDSFVGEVCGRLKQGASFGYTRVLGYHPLLATRADTRETLHIRLRKGSANTQKGIKRFVDELIARVERAGATGVKLLRADSGFWNTKVFERLEQAGWQYSIGVRMIKTVRAGGRGDPGGRLAADRLPRRG